MAPTAGLCVEPRDATASRPRQTPSAAAEFAQIRRNKLHIRQAIRRGDCRLQPMALGKDPAVDTSE